MRTEDRGQRTFGGGDGYGGAITRSRDARMALIALGVVMCGAVLLWQRGCAGKRD